MNKLEKILKILIGSALFLLPWQTIWIYRYSALNGSKWQYGTLGFYATEFIIMSAGIVFILWYYNRLKQNNKPKIEISRDRIFIFSIFLFSVYCLLSSFWAVDPDIAYAHGLKIMETIIFFLILLVGPMSFRESAKYLVAGAVLQSSLGIWQFISQSTFTFKWLGLVVHPVYEAGTSIISNPDIGRWLRAYGAFPHPNIFGGYLLVSIILTTFLFKKEKRKNTFILIAYYLVFTIQISALFFTFSRSAWLGFFLFFIFYNIYNSIKNKLSFKQNYELRVTSYGLIIIFVLSIIYMPLVQTRLLQNSNHESVSVENRISGIENSLPIISKYPFLGAGAGNYTAALYKEDSTRPGWEYQPVHNTFVLVLSELGIIGALLAIFVLISYHRQFGGKLYRQMTFSSFVLLPILLFDHYLWSNYAGLLTLVCFLALSTKFFIEDHT